MLKKYIIGGEEGEYWILTGDIPIGGGAIDSSAFSWPLGVNDERIVMAGTGLPSSDAQQLCLGNTGQLDWSASLTYVLDTGPPRIGQMSGYGSACDDNYVISVHEMEDDNYANGSRGTIQVRDITDGSLVFQKQLTNGRITHVCAENGYGYVGLTADADHVCNYVRVNLSNGTLSATGIRYSPSGNPMRISCDTGSSTYLLTTDTSSADSYTGNTQILKLSSTGSITNSVKYDANFAQCSYASSRADLEVFRDGGVDYVYVFSRSASGTDLNVVKFSTINGASSTVDWQKKITRSGWTMSNGFIAGSVDSSGNAYVISSWDDGGGNSENVIVKLNSSTGAEETSTTVESSGDNFTCRGLKVQPTGVVFTGDGQALIRLPLDLAVSGTYGDYTFADTSDYTVAASSITFSAGTVTDIGDSYTISTSSLTDENVSGTTSLTKTEIN